MTVVTVMTVRIGNKCINLVKHDKAYLSISNFGVIAMENLRVERIITAGFRVLSSMMGCEM